MTAQAMTLTRSGTMGALLFAPASYVNALPEVRLQMVNGCGPGGWLTDLVPDTIYGLDISAACNIHDWMYAEGETIEDKQLADRVFLNNLVRIINHETRWAWLRWLRRRRALKYYLAVKNFGGPFFWTDKNAEDNQILASVAAATSS